MPPATSGFGRKIVASRSRKNEVRTSLRKALDTSRVEIC